MNKVTTTDLQSSPPAVPRNVFDLEDPHIRPESMLRVEGSRVVFADYALLRSDFPQLRGATPAAIDHWLLHNAAVVSEPQAKQSTVNSPIRIGDGRVTAFRPPLYGRAVVVAVDDWPEGLLDVKGCGVAPGMRPVNLAHANGLLALGEALANMAFREVMERIFRRARTGFATVPSLRPCHARLHPGTPGTPPPRRWRRTAARRLTRTAGEAGDRVAPSPLWRYVVQPGYLLRAR